MSYNDPLDTVFHDTVMDYFSKMGGAGQWMVPNYKDWHPVAFTLTVGLRHFGAATEEQYQLARKVLPSALFDGCDGLAEKTEKAFLRFEKLYGRPDKALSFSDNKLIEGFEKISRSDGVRKDMGREYRYKGILSELERFFAVMLDQPSITDHLHGFSFRHKEY